MAARCPEQWRQRYVLGRKTPPAAAMIAGRADHTAIEHSMVQKIETHEDLPVGEVQEMFATIFDQELEESGGFREVEVRNGSEILKGKAEKLAQLGKIKDSGVKYVAGYHTQVSPHVQPIAVEEEFDLRVADLPVRVTGRIDLVAAPPTTPSASVIIDRKRTGRASATPQPEWKIQAGIYQLARPLPHEWHITVTQGAGRYLLPTGGKDDPLTQPVGSRLKAERTLAHIVGEVGYYYRRYGPDDNWPARGLLHPWACGFCGYKPGCWAHT